MTLLKAKRFLLASTLLSGSALAQTHFCIGGDLDHLSLAQKAACRAKLQTVHSVVADLHAPEDWHFVLVCGEDGWKNYAVYSTGDGDALSAHLAETNLEERETFLRESRLDANDLSSFRVTIAHEVAAAALQSKDEIAIQKEMQRLLPALSAKAGL